MRFGGVTPRKPRHRWVLARNEVVESGFVCLDCGAIRDEAAVKRGRNNRKRGGAAELDIARKYGGEKVGPLGLPEDIRGKMFATQVKVSQRSAPPMWLREFAKLDGNGRVPRLILRFTRHGGLATDRTQDFVVMRGSDFLDLLGRDE